jgi:hypothetical protein
MRDKDLIIEMFNKMDDDFKGEIEKTSCTAI